MATPRNRYLWPVTRSTAYEFFNSPRMLALKPPTAALMVAMKKERLNALVRLASVALSASMAPQEDAYIASESPETTAVPTSSGRFVPTIAKRTRVRLAMTPPRPRTGSVRYRSATLRKTICLAHQVIRIRLELFR